MHNLHAFIIVVSKRTIHIKLQACNFIKKETLAQVFSCEFREISKNTFFYRTPLVATSEHRGTLFTKFSRFCVIMWQRLLFHVTLLTVQ